LDFEFITELLECLANELGFVIMDDSSWYAKAVQDVMHDELDHARHLCLREIAFTQF